MAGATDLAQARRVAYSYLTVEEDGLGRALRRGLAELLAATLDDGDAYRERAWRTLRPAYRVVALAAGEPVGQASCFWVPCRPPARLLGLGDVAVAPAHRRRQVARTLCTIATQEGWRLHASAVLAKTVPLRTVLGELGYEEATDGRFFYVENGGHGGRGIHPNWMAAVHDELPATVLLEEGDF
jgi:GNAT superfamily N-acetyltransferase